MKFFYLFTFIFAINFLSVKCVYNKNCSKTCTAEKAWLNNVMTTLPGPKLPVEFDSTFAEILTPPPPAFLFGINTGSPLKLKIEEDYLVAYYDPGYQYSRLALVRGFLPGDVRYVFHSAYFSIAPSYSKSADSSYGNGGNPHTGHPILVTLYFFKSYIGITNYAWINGPASDTDPAAWIKLYLTIEVTGVIDNPSAVPLITDIKNVQTAGTAYTNTGNVFVAFFAQFATINGIFYTPDQDTKPGKNHTDNAIGFYLHASQSVTISYTQWLEFAKLKKPDNESVSHIEEFFPMYDCLPIGQVNGPFQLFIV